MIKEADYLKAKQIVQEYEKQLNISDVMFSVGDTLYREHIEEIIVDEVTEDHICWYEGKRRCIGLKNGQGWKKKH